MSSAMDGTHRHVVSQTSWNTSRNSHGSSENGESLRSKKKGFCPSTMFLIATVMSLGVLLVGLVGFLPMYFIGFAAASHAIEMIHSQAINGFLAFANTAVMQIPTVIHTMAANYILTDANNATFFPEDKTKLLLSISNILAQGAYRDSLRYFMVVQSGKPGEEWGVVAVGFLNDNYLGGSVLHGLEPTPIYTINPKTVNYTYPLKPIVAYNISLESTFTNENRPYKRIVIPWNEKLNQGITWRRRWLTTDISFSLYFNYVLPFRSNDGLGFFESALQTSAFDLRVLRRVLREHGRVMVIDPSWQIVVTNNWNQPSVTTSGEHSNRTFIPLKVDDVTDPLMETMINNVNSDGGFLALMKGRMRKEFSFKYHSSKAYARIVRLKDDLGLDILVCIATLESDFFQGVFVSRVIAAFATGVAVLLVALFAVVIAYRLVKSLRQLAPALKRASNLQLHAEETSEWKHSYISEVQDILDGYSELIRQLVIVKTFVPEAILARGSSDTGGEALRRNSNLRSVERLVHSTSTHTAGASETEMMERSSISKRRQEMRLNSRIFKEQVNTFTRRYCTAVLIENVQVASLDTYFNNILTCAAGLNGCVEYLRPDRTLITFGAHSTLPMHSSKGCRFAFDLFERLSPQEQEKCTILVDSNEFHVGTCGAHSRNARVLVGIMNLRELIKVMHHSGCKIAATAGAASHLQDDQVFPVDCVLLPFSPVPVVLSELRQHAPHTQKMVNLAKHFRLGFAAMRQGYYKQAMSHYQRIERSDVQAQRLLRICAQRCAANDARSYVRQAEEVSETSIPNLNASAFPLRHPTSSTALVDTESSGEGLPDSLNTKTREAFMTGSEKSTAYDEALIEMIKISSTSSSQSIQPSYDGGNGLDDVPLVLTDINQRVWTRSLKKISEGAFSAVFLGMSEDGVQVAIKCIPRRRRDIMQESLEAEMHIASKLRHPNVVQYVSCSVVHSHLAIIMEYLPGGSVYTVIKNFGKLSPRVARRFTVDILNGLNYLHGLGIVHCDVKPHNVLLGMNGVCKLSDFGSTISEAADMVRTMADEVLLRGTALYMAPEVACGGRCTAPSDMYSLGISLLEMLLGRPPWKWSGTAPEGSDAAGLNALMGRDALFVQSLARGHLEPEIPESLDPEAAIFVRSCCHADPAMRPSTLELLSYAFVL